MSRSIFSSKGYLLLGGPADGSWVRLTDPPPPYYVHCEPSPVSVAKMAEVGGATIGPIPAKWVYNPITLRDKGDKGAEYTVFVPNTPVIRVIERLIYGYQPPSITTGEPE